jgi:hypothetical protein
VATAGDVLGEDLAARGQAMLAPPQDVEAVAAQILAWLEDDGMRTAHASRAREIAVDYRWDAVVQPLAEFCAAPRFAADRDYVAQVAGGQRGRGLHKARLALKTGGLRELWRQLRAYLRWKRRY